eukprot:3222089-Rhodomonas_salina.1
MDRAVAKRFMVRQEEKGLVSSMELKAPMAWRLACMDPVDEKTTASVFTEMAAAKMENMEKNELFVRYIRASAFSCHGYYTAAVKIEIEEKEEMGDYGNLSLRCVGIVRPPPKSKLTGLAAVASDKANETFNEDWSWRLDKVHERDELKEELKRFVTKHFTVDGRKPALITAG